MTDPYELSTSHGSIVVEEAGDGDLPVLLIHGNSLSREVFRKQLGGALSRKYRLVAFDPPGHGETGDAPAVDNRTATGRLALIAWLVEMMPSSPFPREVASWEGNQTNLRLFTHSRTRF